MPAYQILFGKMTVIQGISQLSKNFRECMTKSGKTGQVHVSHLDFYF